jgi:hypothetical protein
MFLLIRDKTMSTRMRKAAKESASSGSFTNMRIIQKNNNLTCLKVFQIVI